MSTSAQKIWEPAKFVPDEKIRPQLSYVLIILNTPIESADVFNHLYDGGHIFLSANEEAVC